MHHCGARSFTKPVPYDATFSSLASIYLLRIDSRQQYSQPILRKFASSNKVRYKIWPTPKQDVPNDRYKKQVNPRGYRFRFSSSSSLYYFLSANFLSATSIRNSRSARFSTVLYRRPESHWSFSCVWNWLAGNNAILCERFSSTFSRNLTETCSPARSSV